MNKNNTSHYVELDSLRGLAAILVVVTHLLIVFPLIYSPSSLHDNLMLFILKYLPFTRALFIGGTEAVKLFFVLSGFVLALPFLKGSKISYLPYLLKRYFRIYIPYYVAISLAILLSFLLSRDPIPQLSEWYNTMSWTATLNPQLLLEHFVLISNFDVNALNNVIWSLVHEMRISILFPFIMYSVIHYSWQKNLVAYSLIGLIGFYAGGYGDTFGYMLLFLVGALLAKHKDFFIEFFKNMSLIKRVATCILAYGSYSLHAPGDSYFISTTVTYLNMIGCTLIIIVALSSRRVSQALRSKVMSFFGRISYSLYLYHFIVLVASIKLLYGTLPIAFILLITVVISVILASLSYKYVEKPSIKLGKLVAKRTNTAITKPALTPTQFK